MICKKCDGSGLESPTLVCKECAGTGKIMEPEEVVVAPVVEETFTEDSGEECEAPAVAEEVAE